MPERIRELRIIDGTTFNKTFTAANNAAWNPGTAHKLAVWDVDLSKLVQPGIPSPVIQQIIHAQPAAKAGITKSALSFKTHFGSGSANVTPPMAATLLSHVFGGLYSPSAKTDTVTGSSSTTTKIYTTGTPATDIGSAVLISGEARRVSGVDTTWFEVDMAFSGAPPASTPVVYAHTVYLNPTATQTYWDTLIMGLHAEDAVQTLGCMGPATFGGLKVGELPFIQYDLIVPHWQEVPSAERDTLSSAVADEADESVASKTTGGCWFGDNGTPTRVSVESGDWSVSPGIVLEPIEDRAGLNGIGGFKQIGSKVEASITVYIDEDYGLHADFPSTAKQLTLQFGNVAQNCAAITLPKCYLRNKPTRAKLGNMAGLKLELGAEYPAWNAGVSVPYLYASPIAVHWF